MAGNNFRKIVVAICAALTLAGCEDGANLFAPKSPDGTTGTASRAAQAQTTEREVEAPEVFQANEDGLWDGRPSLGGVWVAYPGVTDPQRVKIRNEANGQSVVGALFNRERENPGPKIQVSSDAASALGILAGQPTLLTVTALRKEEVLVEPAVAEDIVAAEAPQDIDAQPLEPLAAAAAAIDKADAGAAAAAPAAPQPKMPKMAIGDITPASSDEPLPASPLGAEPVAAAAAPSATPLTVLDKPYIQVGIYSMEENAIQAGDVLRGGGVLPTILKQSSNGDTFWRVVVGPAASATDRDALLGKIKDLGFADAYLVTN